MSRSPKSQVPRHETRDERRETRDKTPRTHWTRVLGLWDLGLGTKVQSSGMTTAGKIKKIIPKYAIPGAEVSIECEGFHTESVGGAVAYLDGKQCRISAASSRRVLAS